MTTMPTSLDAVPRHRPGAWLHQSGDEAALLDRDGNRLHLLNPAALAIWELCDGDTTVDEMITAACQLFAADEDVVRRDVISVFEKFSEADLVTWSDTSHVESASTVDESVSQ